MSDARSRVDRTFYWEGPKLDLSLEPLARWGQAVLAPDDSVGLFKVTLVKVGLRWHNAFNEVIIRIADDLFACAAREGRYYDPVPKGAELLQAGFDLNFRDSKEPHYIEIEPPHRLGLQFPADAQRVMAFLGRRGFLKEL